MFYRILFIFLLIFFTNNALAKSNLISIDLNNINTRNALQLLAEMEHVNLVITDDIQDKITLKLNQVTWEEAFSLVLKTKGLSQRKLGKTIWVTKLSEMMKQDAQDWLCYQQNLDLVPLSTESIKINYAKASEVAEILKDKNGILSSRGHLLTDDRIHLLWINDDERHLKMVKKLVQQLDVPLKQIMIEARIANVDRSFERNLGLHFGFSRQLEMHSDENQSEKHSNTTSPIASIKNMPFGMFVAPLGQGVLLDVELSALENEGRGEFISNPKLLTQDQKTAVIQAGEEIPFQERSKNGATSVAFKKAVLSLEVTPRILPNQQLQLDLKVNQDAPGIRLNDGMPMIDTRQIETHVQVKSGQTFVLGGILEESKHKSIDKVPFISQIPLLGRLFESQDKTKEQRELLIFITPTIIH